MLMIIAAAIMIAAPASEAAPQPEKKTAAGGKTQVELVREAAEGAAAVIAIGSCAAWGGVQSATPNPTGAVGTHEVIPHKTVINVPGCPPRPEALLDGLLKLQEKIQREKVFVK